MAKAEKKKNYSEAKPQAEGACSKTSQAWNCFSSLATAIEKRRFKDNKGKNGFGIQNRRVGRVEGGGEDFLDC